MRRFLLVVALFVGVVALVKRFGPKLPGMDWEQRFEHMPDNAPPKWMFRNISAIRGNTDRILELLEQDKQPPAASTPAATEVPPDDSRR